MPGYIFINKTGTSYSSTSSISSGSNTITVGSTSGIELGDKLTKISGTGSFNISAEHVIVTGLTSTVITVSHTHSTSGTISFYASTNIKDSFAYNVTNPTAYNYTPGFISGSNTSTDNKILNFSNVYTTSGTRGSKNFFDVENNSTDRFALPIYTGTDQFKVIQPNTIMRGFNRETVAQSSNYDLGIIAKANGLSSKGQKAMVYLHGAGGGGAGSNPYVLGNFKCGGSGGGAGGGALVYVSNLALYRVTAGSRGTGGAVGSNGDPGGASAIISKANTNYRITATGGSGGVQGKNQMDGANSGGSGGSYSDEAGPSGLILSSGHSGASGGNSNSAGSGVYKSFDIKNGSGMYADFFGADYWWTTYGRSLFFRYANIPAGTSYSGGRLLTGNNDLGRGGGGGASSVQTIVPFANLYDYDHSGGDQIFSATDYTNSNRTSVTLASSATTVVGASMGAGGGGASARGDSGDRQPGGHGGHGFVQISF